MTQTQFLDVIDRDEAQRRFHAVLQLEPLSSEEIELAEALGRVLADDVRSRVNVPSFDRSNYDGYAVRAADVVGAREESPRILSLLDESISAGRPPRGEVGPGQAMPIATGGMMPRGADAVVMIEHADLRAGKLEVRKASAPGFGTAAAASDIAAGETVLRTGTLLTSRETGVLAAIGESEVRVIRRPVVAIISTGDELIAPGEPMQPALVYDSNARILADAVRELGGEPESLGVVRDNLKLLREMMRGALDTADAVVLSGGTSKGQGDLCYQVAAELQSPGIVAHGVALKPGKPICLAASSGKPVVILPGFPTSAVFTFHEFMAPVIRRLGGRTEAQRNLLSATMAVKVKSEIGRTEYLLVGLVDGGDGAKAYPMGKGSGSVTTFSGADGFVTIDRRTERLDAGELVEVHRLGQGLRAADLVIMGSHCLGLDWLLSELCRQGVVVKYMAVGSTAGLEAAKRGECDLAGIHLLDAESGEYNRPFLTNQLELLPGYARRQGIVHRRGDARFEGKLAEEIFRMVATDPTCLMVNRNVGSGTRVLIDRLLQGNAPAGYAMQARSHQAVAAAVAQGRADWGVATQSVAAAEDLGFVFCQDEQFDFVVPKDRRGREGVAKFVELLKDSATRERLREMGLGAR